MNTRNEKSKKSSFCGNQKDANILQVLNQFKLSVNFLANFIYLNLILSCLCNGNATVSRRQFLNIEFLFSEFNL